MKNVFFLIIAITILSMSMVQVQAVKPLYGAMDVQFNLGFLGPQNEIPDWVGYTTINGVVYGIVFYNIGTGKSFTNEVQGNAVFFGEQWVIFSSITLHFDDQGVLVDWSHGSILLSGNDEGVVSLANSLYRMNGAVQIANPPFQSYLGSTVHMNGTIQWYDDGNPHFAPGTFRIN